MEGDKREGQHSLAAARVLIVCWLPCYLWPAAAACKGKPCFCALDCNVIIMQAWPVGAAATHTCEAQGHGVCRHGSLAAMAADCLHFAYFKHLRGPGPRCLQAWHSSSNGWPAS
eukprot:1161305-Pelagomonas_calceolata.AAC.5